MEGLCGGSVAQRPAGWSPPHSLHCLALLQSHVNDSKPRADDKGPCEVIKPVLVPSLNTGGCTRFLANASMFVVSPHTWTHVIPGLRRRVRPPLVPLVRELSRERSGSGAVVDAGVELLLPYTNYNINH